uniref:Uncharacterized protein n=1 Tax=Tanacetum cinerariifolium TaxID=118510 RepID=A0A6L2L3F0_TANCI|nr:hypothetical protein [Tanacetum cinerariifolium]
MTKVKKPKKSWSKEILTSARPSKPRTYLRWLPIGRIYDLKGKLIESSYSKCQSDCSKGDNARTSNPQEPIRNVHFANDPVAKNLGYGGLQWGNILIAWVYYVEGLGHNWTKKIMKTMNVTFDELSPIGFEQRSSKLELQGISSGQISSGLGLTYAPSTIVSQKPTERELDLLLEAMYYDYSGGQPSTTPRTTLAASAPLVLYTPTASTTTADTAPTPTNSSLHAADIPNTSQDVDELQKQQHDQQQDD